MKDKEMNDKALMQLCGLLFENWDGSVLTAAKTVLEHYQSKLPENSIVLSKEEYELYDIIKKGYPNDISCLAEKFTEIDHKARKETVERTFNKVREMLNNCETVCEYNKFLITPKVGYLIEDVDDGLDKIEKQFGEIKE